MTSKIHITNYSPFGVHLQNRNFTGEKYRYGFNGQEKDDEVKSEGNSYTTEFRQYDPRLGRWMTIDLLASYFPANSPYEGFASNPVFFRDPYGLAPTNEGGPEKVTIDISKDKREYTAEYLPKTAEQGQVIELINPASELPNFKLTAVFDSKMEKWAITTSYNGSESSMPSYQEGWIDNLPKSNVTTNETTSSNTIANNNTTQGPALSKTYERQVANKAEKASTEKTTKKVADIVSTTTTVWGVIAKTVETSAEDMATPPRYRSTDVPNKKAWEPVAKGFKTVARYAKYAGNALGIVSAVNNRIHAANKFAKGDIIGGLKSTVKAVGDAIMIAVKASPIGLLVSVGWAIFSSWW